MNVWNVYSDRMAAKGGSRRGAALQKEQEFLRRHMHEMLAYNIAEVDGVNMEIGVIDSDDYTRKTIYTMPGKSIRGGAMIFWKNSWWVVTSKDINDEVHMRLTMERCNYKLKWIDPDGQIKERWCIITDGTKLSFVNSFRVQKCA